MHLILVENLNDQCSIFGYLSYTVIELLNFLLSIIFGKTMYDKFILNILI